MKKTVLIFGMLAFAVIALLQVSKYTLISGALATEWIVAIIAVIFFCIGVFLQKKSLNTPVKQDQKVNQKQIDVLGLSKREYEVLLEMAAGYSNKEIAERLFVSESTIKTHVSNVFVKLDAKRRTQAIQKAKTLQILPL
jgi:DNA-binding NarL/FixJ family response regulator